MVEIIDTNRASLATAAGLGGAVVVGEVIAALEGDDRVVVGITVSGDFVEAPFRTSSRWTLERTETDWGVSRRGVSVLVATAACFTL